MDRTPSPASYQFARGLFAAVAVATVAKAGLVLVLPYVLQSGLSALAGNLSDAQLHWEVLKPAALARGAAGAALCLVPGLLLAWGLKARLADFALAGALAEFVHNGLSRLLLEPALHQMDRALFYANLRPELLILQGDAAVTLASILAGALAGAMFGADILPEERGKPAIYWRPIVFLPAMAAALLGWIIFHDREGDQICAHERTVRVLLAGKVYRFPTLLQPILEPLNPKTPLHIFNGNYHLHAPAAEAAHYRSVYCQMADEPPWPVRSFMVRGAILGIAPTPLALPHGVNWLGLFDTPAGTASGPGTLQLNPPAVPGLEWLAGHKTAYAQLLPGGKVAVIVIQLANGGVLSAELQFDPADEMANIPAYRRLGDFLAVSRVNRPERPASASR